MLIGQEANKVAEGAARKENYRIAHEHVMTALEVVTTVLDAAVSFN